MTSLWNERFGAMSFGPHRFDAQARYEKIFLRYLLFYLAPFIIFVGVIVVGLVLASIGAASGSFSGTPSPERVQVMAVIAGTVFVLLYFVVLGTVALIFYAAYFREAVGNTALGGLEFAFNARTLDWIKLFLGNFALVLVTLGIGYVFLGYRNWAFFIRPHGGLTARSTWTTSPSRRRACPETGEGLLDAFDVGAF